MYTRMSKLKQRSKGVVARRHESINVLLEDPTSPQSDLTGTSGAKGALRHSVAETLGVRLGGAKPHVKNITEFGLTSFEQELVKMARARKVSFESALRDQLDNDGNSIDALVDRRGRLFDPRRQTPGKTPIQMPLAPAAHAVDQVPPARPPRTLEQMVPVARDLSDVERGHNSLPPHIWAAVNTIIEWSYSTRTRLTVQGREVVVDEMEPERVIFRDLRPKAAV